VLECAEPGTTNLAVAARLGISNLTVGKWRRSFAQQGLEGLGDAPRSGVPRSILDEHIERVITTTLQSTPRNATHWSTRFLAIGLGMSQTGFAEYGAPLRWRPTAARRSSSPGIRTLSTRFATLSGCTLTRQTMHSCYV